MQIGGWTIREENTDIYPWYQNLCCALIQFLNARQDFRKNERHSTFRSKLDVIVTALPSLNTGTYSKFDRSPNVSSLGIGKIYFKNLHSFLSYLEKTEGRRNDLPSP